MTFISMFHLDSQGMSTKKPPHTQILAEIEARSVLLKDLLFFLASPTSTDLPTALFEIPLPRMK